MNALSDGMSAITTTATPPTLFDWKKTDDLRGLLLTSHKSMLTHRSHTEILVKAINQLRIPFADVSAEKSTFARRAGPECLWSMLISR
jgi:hypothetical protein